MLTLLGGANRYKEFNDVWRLNIAKESNSEANKITYKL